MSKIELEMRTKQFSLQLIRFLESLPKNYLGETLGRQLLKSGTPSGQTTERRIGQSLRPILSIS